MHLYSEQDRELTLCSLLRSTSVTSKRAKASQTCAQRTHSHVDHRINQSKQCRTQSTGILLKLLILTPRT